MTNTLDYKQLEQLIANAGGTPSQQQILAGIAEGAESSGNPIAQNPDSTASGLWQELTTTWIGAGGSQYAATAAEATPQEQAQIAVNQVNADGGYAPWAPDLGGSYGSGQTDPTEPDAGSKVANYLSTVGSGNSTVTPSSTTTPAGAGTAASSAVTLTGVAGIFQKISDLMNPSSGGTIEQLTTLGTSDIGAILETVIFRALFSIGFLGVAYVGLKQITGGSSTGINIVENVQQGAKNDLAQQRIDAANADRQSRERNAAANAQARAEANASRERVAATPKTYARSGGFTNTSTVKYQSTKAAKAKSTGAAKATESVAGDLAEGALLV